MNTQEAYDINELKNVEHYIIHSSMMSSWLKETLLNTTRSEIKRIMRNAKENKEDQ